MIIEEKEKLLRFRRCHLSYIAQLRFELDSLFDAEADEAKFQEVNLEIELTLKDIEEIDNELRTKN